MEGRMTVCNMSIEGGARAGLIAPDETTYEYIKGRPMAPKAGTWEQAVTYWRTLPSDEGARYDKEVTLSTAEIDPQVTWGTSPEDVVPITGRVPNPDQARDENKRQAMLRALDYMGLEADTPMTEIKVDKVFIGSCTNGRIEDLREAAKVAEGRKVAEGVYAMIVPGSGLVKEQAEAEGRTRRRRGAKTSAGQGCAPSTTWASRPTRRGPRSRATRCSSAPAPTGASRTGARPPRWPKAARSPRASTP